MCGDGWIKAPIGVFKKEYWFHPTKEVGWIRTETESGEWTYSGVGTLVGSKGKPRRIRGCIEGKSYLRHRLIALAEDGTPEGIAKFLDWKNNPVEHKKRRREDERPDDTPENVRFGTHSTNNADPNRKKRKVSAAGHPVRLSLVSTGVPKTVDFYTVLEAAAFLGVDGGNLRSYLSGGRRNSMPESSRGVWEAAYIGFDLPDAVRIVRAAGELYLSRSRPNEIFRKLPDGKFSVACIEKDDDGYTRVGVGGKKRERIHRLVIDTFEPTAFSDKLSKMPAGSTYADIQVDHVDGDESNNDNGNLRLVDRTEHARKRAFPIVWVDRNGNVLEEFECAADVVNTVLGVDGKKLNLASVHYVCDEKCTHTGGRIFRWKDGQIVKKMREESYMKRCEKM